MKNFFFNPFFLFFFFSFTSISYSQERTVTGIVTTLENIAVVNAEVKVLSSNVTVLTDTVGNFKVNCLLNDKIKISANGFYSQKVKINKKTKESFINLMLKPGEKKLNVALEHGHIKEKDKSSVISNIKNNDILEFSKYSSMLELIVNSSHSVVLSGGEIIIRGVSSILGSSAALIVIDDIAVGMLQLSLLSPVNVKSIDVLKGGSMTKYGSRGSNGVVVITTKKEGDEVEK